MKAIAALIGCALLMGCDWLPPSGPTVTPVEVLANIHAWSGKEMLVAGWIGQCSAYDCAIYESLDDLLTVEAGNSKSTEWQAAASRSLSIGPDTTFDWWARQKYQRRVIVRAIVSDECHQQESGKFCLDRAGDLKPIQIYSAN